MIRFRLLSNDSDDGENDGKPDQAAKVITHWFGVAPVVVFEGLDLDLLIADKNLDLARRAVVR